MEETQLGLFDGITRKFNDRRELNTESISEIIFLMKDIRKLVDLQLLSYSKRHEVVDKRGQVFQQMAKLSMRRDKLAKEYTDSLEKTNQVLLKSRQVSELTKHKMTEYDTAISLLSAWITYETDVIKTLDSVIYGIKYRIEAHDLQ